MTATTSADEARYALALACIPRLGPVAVRRLHATHGDARVAFALAAPDERAAAHALHESDTRRSACASRGIDIVALFDPRYPSALRDLEDPPIVLYTLGTLALTRTPSVALVGSRRATAYGRLVVRDFARRLAARGICVVSGLAMGIDAEAHSAALDGHGPTVAVQGTGVDVAYPRSNASLHARIARDGLVLSELPPGSPAHPGAFPRRNRLIAALADVIVVVEAGVRSGALITAQLGGELGRVVAAVPGPIDVDASAGANQLLRDGAQVVASFDDLLSLLALTRRGGALMGERIVACDDGPQERLTASDGPVDPASPEGKLLGVLAFGPRAPDELVRVCGVSPREVGAALANLSMRGAVDIDPSGMVRRHGDARTLTG